MMSLISCRWNTYAFNFVERRQRELSIQYTAQERFSSKDAKESYPYNIPLKKDSVNRLMVDSHVKCDFIYEGIGKDDILMVVGSVTPEQMDSFWNAYEAYLDEIESAGV